LKDKRVIAIISGLSLAVCSYALVYVTLAQAFNIILETAINELSVALYLLSMVICSVTLRKRLVLAPYVMFYAPVFYWASHVNWGSSIDPVKLFIHAALCVICVNYVHNRLTHEPV